MWKRRKFVFCLIILQVCLIEAANGKEDICAVLCRCVNESRFVKIHCDFINDKEYTLDGGFQLPSMGSALNITLGDKTRLAIKSGFFDNGSRINSVAIQGSNGDFKVTENRVELWKQAMKGIDGVLPEISFKNLKTVLLTEKSLDNMHEINLVAENIWQLTAFKEVFGTTSCNATFSDISDLVLNESVLATSNYNLSIPKIYINRSWIKEFMPLRGKKLTELRIENSEIDTVKSSAFNVMELPSLILDNVTIGSIETNIFREGTALENLAVTNCRIVKIESKAIRDVGITKFTFEKNTINSIEGSAIKFDGSNVVIADNTINNMGAEWLKFSQWHKVVVRNNTFGSFDSIAIDNPASSVENVQCTFHHNSFTKVQLDGFKSISGRCQFTELLFKQNCACNFHTWLAKLFDKSRSEKQLQSESFCSLDASDTLFKCLKAETVKYDQYRDEICSNKKSKPKCDRVKVDRIEANFIDPKDLSEDFDWMDYIHYMVIVAVGAVLVPCICITIAVKRKSRTVASDHYAHGTMHHQTDLLQLNQSEGPPSYEASLRSTKTFSNRDHIIIKRTLETMKAKQPEEKYELVSNNTRRLLHEHLNEYEKVRIIGDIVQTIGECENSGEDFVAFTDILYKHLAPDETTTLRNTTVPRPQAPLDGLYAEPVLPQTARDPAKANSEHIYAEPNVLTQQQTLIPLLLANNYSSPVDNANSNLYSEPVIHEQKNIGSSTFKPKVATPYAISDSIEQPSTSKNLPDIINRMEPGPSGELNRITRSPKSNRVIPEYTMPSTSHKAPVRVTQDTIEDWSDESMENSQSSNHSGGSNATVKIDELVNDI